MAKAATRTSITLELSLEEALFIKGLVQNPVGCTPEEESPSDSATRKTIWEALANV